MAMSLFHSLRPENGPIGSALSTWLDFAPSGLATRFVLLWFVILFTTFQVLSHASAGLDTEMLELYAAALHPAAGYYGQAPLAALVATGWFSIVPPTRKGNDNCPSFKVAPDIRAKVFVKKPCLVVIFASP